jgi:hypothetical protein
MNFLRDVCDVALSAWKGVKSVTVWNNIVKDNSVEISDFGWAG